VFQEIVFLNLTTDGCFEDPGSQLVLRNYLLVRTGVKRGTSKNMKRRINPGSYPD